jgi:hypothetical protein
MDRESKTNKAFIEAEDSKYLARLYRDAITVPFALTPDQHEALSNMYAPRVIRAGTAKPPCGTHAIAASHQRIAQQEAYEFARNAPNLIEIGPNAANMAKIAIGNPNIHGCTLWSARDQSRHLKAAASANLRGYLPSKQQNSDIEHTGFDRNAYHMNACALASGLPTDTFCVNGWQNCTFQAGTAIAVHSLYDISLMHLAVGMREHNTNHIRAWMHFPTQALEVASWTDYERGYRFKTRKVDGQDCIDFTWSDSAFGYTHNKEDWLAYLKVGAFETPFGFSVTIEKTYVNGSQFTLDIHRVTSAGSFFYNIESSLIGLCKVPNFRVMAARKFCKQQEIPYIITDAEKIKKLFQFIHARAEKGFSLETVKAYARTLICETRLGAKIVEARWHCNIEEFSDLTLSIYILALFRRMVDAEVLSDAISHLHKLGETQGFGSQIYHWICDTFKVEHRHVTNHKLDDESNRVGMQSRNLFKRAALVFFESYDQHDQISECKYDHGVIFPFNPDFVEALPEIRPTLEQIAAAAEYPVLPNPEAVYCDWALDFSIKAETMQCEVQQAYISEDQHSNLVMETERGVQQATIDEKKALASVLGTANAAFRTRRPTQLHVENMAALTGVPGAGKTNKIINEIVPAVVAKGGSVLILCPVRALVDKYTPDLQLPNMAATIHAGLNHLKKEFTLVVIEEAFTLPMAYINFIASYGKVLLVGDPNQISHVDFSGLWGGCSKLNDYMGYIPTEHMSVTRRCPVDIANLPIIKAAYPGITSTSKKITSIQYVPANYVNPSAATITFTQGQKLIQTTTYHQNGNSVHEVQGQTFPSVILHYAGTRDERELISKSKAHLIVGLTRHTGNLFIRDLTENNELSTFINDSNPLNTIADASNIDLQALDSSNSTKAIQSIDTQITSDREYPCSKSEAGNAEMILHKYYPAPPQKEHVAQTSTALPRGEDMNGSLRMAEIHAEEQSEIKPKKIYRFPVPQRVKVTRPSNKHLLVRTNLERLAHRTKNLPDIQAEAITERLFEQSSKEFNWDLSDQDKHTCFLEAIMKMEARGHGMDDFKDIADWNDMNVKVVKSFLKSQQKPTLGKDPLEADKAGQGISAWDKTLNTLMCAWTRLLEVVLVKQSKGRVKITTGMTDREVMSILEQDGRPDDKFIDNDWELFDSNQNNITRKLLLRALKKLGCPQTLLEEFEKMLKERRICMEALSLLVHDKKDSGAPHTLIDNCWFNLNICLDLMNGFRVLYIKGDDSLARGKNVSFDFEKMKYYGEKCGFRFKPNSSHSGNFVSFLVNKYGVAYDLPRITAKVLSKCYTNAEDFENYQEAVSATLMHVHEVEGHNMCLVNAYHVDINNATNRTSDFDTLLSFLKRFARKEIPFSQTIESEFISYKTDGDQASHARSSHFIDNTHIRKADIVHSEKNAPTRKYKMTKRIANGFINLIS